MSSTASVEREIREAGLDQLALLCAIDRRCFSPALAYGQDDMRAALSEKGVRAIIAEVDGRATGFVLYRRWGGRAHIITLDVLPEFQRQGIGRRLISEAHARLERSGAVRFRLETAVDNGPAIVLFSSVGYERVGRIKAYYPDGRDAWVMERVVGPPPGDTAPSSAG